MYVTYIFLITLLYLIIISPYFWNKKLYYKMIIIWISILGFIWIFIDRISDYFYYTL
jgi:hypothetical protein